VLMTPFLPFSSQRLHEMLGYTDVIASQPEVREYEEAGGIAHRVQGSEYDATPRWRPSELAGGQRLLEPRPLFKKIDPEVAEEELRRMAGD
jgi:methionyl-tRNA synthetase